jgi:hypothetical protein
MRHINTIIENVDDYITSSKSIKRNGNGIVLESQHGCIKFDFSSVLGGNEVEFLLKRVSGNGRIAIFPGDGDYLFTIGSKVKQSVFLSVIAGSQIEIVSPKESIGEVALISITIYTNHDDEKTMNWKPILSKFTHSGLRAVGNCLFASAGATISTSAIEIETSPPQQTQFYEGHVNFLGVCEVTSITFKEELPTILRDNRDAFPSLSAPMEIIAEPILTKTESSSSPTTLRPIPTSPQVNRDLLIYDSSANRDFNPQKNKNTNATKFIVSNNQDFLILKKGGRYCCQVDNVQSGMQYVVVINGKKLNGNGRAWVSFGRGEAKEVILDGVLTERYVNVTIARQEPILTLEMLDDCVGELIINRIRIINGISIEEAKSSIEYSIGSNNFICVRQQIKSIISDFSFEDDRQRDPVALSAIENAKFKPLIADDRYMDVTGSMSSTTKSGISYISKVQGFFPNVQVFENKNLIRSDTFVFCSIDDIVGEHVWIDHFSKEISDTSKEALLRTKRIFSPSAANAQQITKVTGKPVTVAVKPLPICNPVEVKYFNNKYCLMLDRHPATTKSIIDAWDTTLPPLALLGGRGSYPANLIPINEYLDYKRILYIVKNAKCLIDVRPNGSDYISGWGKVAGRFGVPLVTNSWSEVTAESAVLLPNWQSHESITTTVMDACSASAPPQSVVSFELAVKNLLMS